jgi:UDP-N-acetylmuramoyl-L-alanyl-D-glutamate--2,6-diaminopimelate ligase
MSRQVVSFAALLELARRRETRPRAHSGQVEKGDAFVVLPAPVPAAQLASTPGGERYIPAALAAGASYVVAASDPGELPQGVAFVPHPDTRAAVGELASVYYSAQGKPLKLIGVTGTNGKTTATYLLEEFFKAQGHKAGVIGTVEYRWPGHREDSPLTTPGCLELHALLADMRDAGADLALMEVSSHALDQNRVAGLSFDGALFTNLTQDHLDYHADMERYFAAKARLFLDPEQGGAPAAGKALAVNSDDAYGEKLLVLCPEAVSYGLKPRNGRHLRGVILGQSPEGLRLRMEFENHCWELFSPLVGLFNAMNLLSAQAMALALGATPDRMRALAGFCGVSGRLERIPNPDGLAVFVDYAHTPDALQKALQALRSSGFTRVITVFGCGGNRDRTKRPRMGEAAAALSDIVVLTSDNPRKEDPLDIMADVLPGLAACKHLVQEADRRKAIELALNLMRPGDALLIAGKGHESYQIVGTVKYPFSDQQVVREVLGCV